MDWNGQRVCVTGGASFIGSHLVDALRGRGAFVRVVDDLSSGILRNLEQHLGTDGFEFMQGDLLEPGVARSAVDGMHVVFHLAAVHGGRGFVDLHQAATAANFTIDGLVFQGALRAGVDKVVYASSGCVYRTDIQDDPTEILYLKEADVGPPYDADNIYGWAKLMGEFTLQSLCEATPLKAACCRYFTVYGPRGVENHAVMAMIARAYTRQSPYDIWGTGAQIRNWTYVADIVSGTIAAAENIDDGTAVNLGTTERTSVLEAAQAAMAGVGHEAELRFLTDMPTGPYNRVADNSFAKEHIGWEPATPFMDGLKKTIAWYTDTYDRDQSGRRLAHLLTNRGEADTKS